MADTTVEIREYVRDVWTLSDLRDLVSDVVEWDDEAAVSITSPSFRSVKGAIEVSREA